MRITIDVTEAEARATMVEQQTTAAEPREITSPEAPPIDGGAPPEALLTAVQGTTASQLRPESGVQLPESGAQPGDGGGPPNWLLETAATDSLRRFPR
jgi:hypothetical protein